MQKLDDFDKQLKQALLEMPTPEWINQAEVSPFIQSLTKTKTKNTKPNPLEVMRNWLGILDLNFPPIPIVTSFALTLFLGIYAGTGNFQSMSNIGNGSTTIASTAITGDNIVEAAWETLLLSPVDIDIITQKPIIN